HKKSTRLSIYPRLAIIVLPAKIEICMLFFFPHQFLQRKRLQPCLRCADGWLKKLPKQLKRAEQLVIQKPARMTGKSMTRLQGILSFFLIFPQFSN
ncbi:MAG: hypothetical protein Q7J80_06375, partial [Anaerolineales bacterium]|nr:hypothetical protein [Anaerolineales bacterium]